MDIPAHTPPLPAVDSLAKPSKAAAKPAAAQGAPGTDAQAAQTLRAGAQAPADARAVERGRVESVAAPPREKLDELVEKLNSRVNVAHRNVQFAVDDSTGRTVITLSDSQSGEVIRQIPSDAVLRLVERLSGATSDSERSPYSLEPGEPSVGTGALLDEEL